MSVAAAAVRSGCARRKSKLLKVAKSVFVCAKAKKTLRGLGVGAKPKRSKSVSSTPKDQKLQQSRKTAIEEFDIPHDQASGCCCATRTEVLELGESVKTLGSG